MRDRFRLLQSPFSTRSLAEQVLIGLRHTLAGIRVSRRDRLALEAAASRTAFLLLVASQVEARHWQPALFCLSHGNELPSYFLPLNFNIQHRLQCDHQVLHFGDNVQSLRHRHKFGCVHVTPDNDLDSMLFTQGCVILGHFVNTRFTNHFFAQSDQCYYVLLRSGARHRLFQRDAFW